jgi:GT2 family glycosyltransferase
MVAGLLAAMGYRVGEPAELLGVGADNPRGFYERLDVVALNDSLLGESGHSWFNPVRIEAASDEAQQGMGQVVARLNESPWLLKDPRLVFTWGAWADSAGDTLPIYVFRGAVEVASSLERRNGISLDFGLALWEAYNREVLQHLQGRDFIALSYEAFAANPQQQLAHLQEQLRARGCEFDQSSPELAARFDQQLNHSRSANPAIADLLTPAQTALTQYCQQLIATGELAEPLPAIDPALALRLDTMSRAHAHAMEAGQLAIELDEKQQQMSATLAQLHETETKLTQVHQAEIDARQDRDKLLKAHEQLTSEHEELAVVHRRDNEELDQLRPELSELREQLNELQEKADYLFYQLDLTYQRLLDYADSGLGKIQGLVSSVYKLLTLRRGLSTAYEDILGDATVHFEQYDRDVAPARTTRLSLLIEVCRYVRENPSGSRRSFSVSRLKRALSVFLKSDQEDLQVWVNQRFPTEASRQAKAVLPDLGPAMDSLELAFPVAESPRVSIVVPVYNQYRMTMFCLQSVLEHSGDVEYEVILADDASSDLTSTIEQRVSGLVLERGAQNRGFVRNCNAGAEHARGEYILFLNNDTGVTAGWLSSLVRLLDARSDAGVVGPKLLFGNGLLQEAGGIIWDDASGWNYGRMDDEAKPDFNYVKEADYVSGACLMIRTSLWQDLGGFDLRYVPAYYEDTDICFAARAAGFSVLYQPASRVYHFEGISNGTDLGSGIKQYQLENQQKFLDKWQSVLSQDHFPNAESVFQARDRSRRRRTILVIDHYVPSFDKDAGSRSTWLYLKLFVEMGYNVKFVGANFFPHQPYTEALQQQGIEVLVGEHIARHFDSWLNEHVEDIHAIYIHRPHVAEQFLKTLNGLSPRPPLIFFGHDLHYLRKEREQAISGDQTLEKEVKDWRRREFQLFSHMDHVYYPSQVEVDEIHKQLPDLSLQAIPLYVVDSEPPPAFSPVGKQGILFVGGFNHPPNADGIGWFVDEVLPRVRQENPALELHIVGSNVPAEVQALSSAGVVVHGYLSDEELETLYGQIQLVVVPLRFGAGVKGKVVEALQHGVPIVTTSIGAEGLPEAASVLHIADDSEQFAQRVLNAASCDDQSHSMLSGYAEYLYTNFSKAKAGDIIRRDFGEPVLES